MIEVGDDAVYWRQGRKNGRNIYRHANGDQSGEHVAVAFEPLTAAAICAAMNELLKDRHSKDWSLEDIETENT
jgi:hypothetical protein